MEPENRRCASYDLPLVATMFHDLRAGKTPASTPPRTSTGLPDYGRMRASQLTAGGASDGQVKASRDPGDFSMFHT